MCALCILYSYYYYSVKHGRVIVLQADRANIEACRCVFVARIHYVLFVRHSYSTVHRRLTVFDFDQSPVGPSTGAVVGFRAVRTKTRGPRTVVDVVLDRTYRHERRVHTAHQWRFRRRRRRKDDVPSLNSDGSTEVPEIEVGFIRTQSIRTKSYTRGGVQKSRLQDQ